VGASSLLYYTPSMAEKNKKVNKKKEGHDDIDTSEAEDEQMKRSIFTSSG
jgi:hypothetical protein